MTARVRLASGLLGALAGLACTPPLPASELPAPADAVPLDVDEEVVHYRVAGDDLEALRDALRSQAVSDRTGGSHGRTHSTLEIEYIPKGVEGGCRAERPRIRMHITTTLPEWEPGNQADDSARKRWREVAAALQRHEAMHREHALAAARELQAALATIGDRPDCRKLGRAIDRAFLLVTLKARLRDDRYDARTRNGLEEGIEL